MIEYRDSLVGIAPEMLQGFFVGWKTPHTPEQHLEILKNSDHVVGFITALSDHIQSAFIPMLEILPEYQGQGIGTRLTRMMLEKVEHIQAIDLSCDKHLQPFYEKFGMLRSVGMVLRNYLSGDAGEG